MGCYWVMDLIGEARKKKQEQEQEQEQGPWDAFTMAVATAAKAQRRVPSGCGFRPSDKVIVRDYLRNKVLGKPIEERFFSDAKFSDLFQSHPNRFVPCDKILRHWYFFVPTEKDLELNSKEVIMVGDGTEEGFWKFQGDSYAIHNEDGQIMGLKRDAVFYRIRASNPTKPKRTHWAMDLYQLPILLEPSSNTFQWVEKWSAVKIRRGKSYVVKKSKDPRYYRFVEKYGRI